MRGKIGKVRLYKLIAETLLFFKAIFERINQTLGVKKCQKRGEKSS